MATLTGEQLKDSYQSLVTIGDSISSNPTVGALENGKGTLLSGVGVGTNSPSGLGNAIIEVFNGTDTQLVLRNNNNFGTIFNGATVGDPTSVFSNTGFKFAIADDKNATNFSEKMRIKSTGDISFRDTSTNEAFYWDASTARLGIGTTNPKDTLDVVDGISVTDSNTALTTNTVLNGIDFYTSDPSFASSTSNRTARIVPISDDSVGQSFALGFYTASTDTDATERMRIDSSGNVGINNSNPNYKIHTESGIARTNTSKNEIAFLSSSDADDFRFGGLFSHKGGVTGSDRYFSIDTASYTVSTGGLLASGSLVLQQLGGNVGIGTDSPSAGLHVEQSGTDVSIISRNTNNNASVATSSSLKLGITSTVGTHDSEIRAVEATLNSNGTKMEFYNEFNAVSYKRMQIDSNGDVNLYDDTGVTPAFFWDASAESLGIGTTSPSNTTHIYKNASMGSPASFTSANAGLRIQDSSNSMYFDGNGIVADGAGPFEIGTTQSADVVLFTNAQEKMRILSSGGLTFNGDTTSANALDDYEEGTFDATIYEVGGSDIIASTGDYVKIGSLVHIQVQAFGGTTGGAGVVRMNLPFTQTSIGGANIPSYSVSNGNIVSVFCIGGDDFLEFVDTIGAIASGNKSIGSDWSSASRLYFNFTYTTL